MRRLQEIDLMYLAFSLGIPYYNPSLALEKVGIPPLKINILQFPLLKITMKTRLEL